MFADHRPLPSFSVRTFLFHAFLWMLSILGASVTAIFVTLAVLGLI